MKKSITSSIISLRVLIPFAMILIAAAVIASLYVENHSIGFYNSMGRPPQVTYSNFNDWAHAGAWDSDTIKNIFYRFAFNLHASIVVLIKTIFGNSAANNINGFQSTNFDIYVSGAISLAFLISIIAVFVPLWCRTGKAWKVVSLVFGWFFIAIAAAFFVWMIVNNADHLTYPFTLAFIPYFLYVPFCLTCLTLAWLIWYSVICGFIPKNINKISGKSKSEKVKNTTIKNSQSSTTSFNQ